VYSASCKISAAAKQNYVMVISADMADATTADHKCSAFGGVLASTVEQQVTNTLVAVAQDKYGKGKVQDAFWKDIQ